MRLSIHAPREGSDYSRSGTVSWLTSFLSTLPVRGATIGGSEQMKKAELSIHAPREGSDAYSRLLKIVIHTFYPRSP